MILIILENYWLKKTMSKVDNVLASISVNRKCELIKKTSIVCPFETEGNIILWNSIETFDE